MSASNGSEKQRTRLGIARNEGSGSPISVMTDMGDRMPWTSSMLFAAALCVAPTSSAAELRPFTLPSQTAQQPAVQQRAPGNASNAYYDAFARDVKQMDQQRVAALRADFQKQLSLARSSNREGDQAHYERMLGILDAYGKTGK